MSATGAYHERYREETFGVTLARGQRRRRQGMRSEGERGGRVTSDVTTASSQALIASLLLPRYVRNRCIATCLSYSPYYTCIIDSFDIFVFICVSTSVSFTSLLPPPPIQPSPSPYSQSFSPYSSHVSVFYSMFPST